MSAKLWPEEKSGPSAASTTPSAPESPTARKASVTSSITSSESALRFSGRFSVIVVRSPSSLTCRCWYAMSAAYVSLRST